MEAKGEFAKLDAFLSGGGCKQKGASAPSLLPSPVTPAWYDAEDKSWYGQKDLSDLTAKEKRNVVQCTMLVQYSPTARAKCRRCGEIIDKGVLRLGYPWRLRENEDAYTLWLHPECYVPEVFDIKEKDLRKKVFGWEALNNTERARVWKAMRSSGRAKAASSEGKEVTADFSKGIVAADKAMVVPSIPVPKQIIRPLLPFQKEGLAWMCRQEQTAVKGGILADEMGMGKTIQAISLMLALPVKGPTLVVCPMAAVHQWVNEIARFTAKGSLRTLVYHGAQKASLVAEFKRHDVVVTTYQTMENEYRRELNKTRVTCKYCKKMFLPEKLKVHQRYFCGPTAERTAKQQKTARKDHAAAAKGMATMGIGQSASSASVYAAPTISNIYKDCMKQAGKTIKATGYWNIMKEAKEKAAKEAKASPRPSSSSKQGEVLNRERLVLMDREELQGLLEARGLPTSGNKKDMIERLMDFVVRGMATGKKPGLGRQLVASARAKAKAKATAKVSAKASGSAKAAGGKLGKKGAKAPATPARGEYARTVAGERAAKASAGSVAGKKGKKGAAGKGKKSAAPVGKGVKRKHGQMEKGGAAPDSHQDVETYEGVQLDLSGSPLHAVAWSRIILDEAHRIKGRTNSTAQAAYALQTNGFKWCLSGTPIQNRVGELYSLIRFLRVRPYAYYYCKIKGCNCECSRFFRERYCPNCGHVRFCHYSHFKCKVSNPIIKYGYMGAGKEAFSTLRNDVLKKIMLRRTKEERQADLKLPKIKIMIRKDKLSKQEKDFYSSLYMQSCVKFDTYVQGGTILHNYAHIFDLLTSLRRAADHPYLIVHGGNQIKHKLPSGVPLMPKLGVVCGLCQDDVIEDGEETKRVAKCGHAFHDDCIRAYLVDAPKLRSGGVGCPVCFTRLSVDLEDDGKASDDEERGSSGKGKAKAKATKRQAKAEPSTPMKRQALAICDRKTPVKGSPKGALTKSLMKRTPVTSWGSKGIMQKVRAADFQSSSKIEAVFEEVQKMMKSDKTAKAIVFSQFGAMLELVEFRLKRAGIACLVFRGGMTMQARDDALAAFNNDASIKIILISLKAGGEGLNLQVANHVFLLDPWWNPACEMQAIQRAHRIGQTREVRAIRFIMANTIEEKILALQEKKQLVFDATIDGSGASMAKLTEQDLRFLFQH